MTDEEAALKWGVTRRLEFIEFRLFWEGGVNRADLIEMFGVSVPQASKDLTLYQERAPNNAVYDKYAKRYVASPRFSPTFLKPDADGYLSRLQSLTEGLTEKRESWIAKSPEVALAPTLHRDVDTGVLRAVLDAIRERRSIEIRYQSMGKERINPTWRAITPHALGYDGQRWHARAFCHIDTQFKDFSLGRILGVGKKGDPGAAGAEDVLWRETFDIEIAPHPKLSPDQRAVVAKDYGMKKERAVISVRYAMLFYVLNRLGLLDDARKQSPRAHQIVVINFDETRRALKRAG